MSGLNFIWCGPDPVPTGYKRGNSKSIWLNTRPSDGNVHLKIENIQTKLLQNLTSPLQDLLEIGSYIYSADQSISRGGAVGKGDGKDWRRDFHFDIQVRNPDFWNRSDIKESLIETVGFLSEDNYEFEFGRLTEDIPKDGYFTFDQGRPWFEADSILLFSGGLDSLAGTIQEIFEQKKKTILVSHRPVPKISKRQTDLLNAFRNHCAEAELYYHIPVWVNKGQELTKDTNQRTRSFLYATLAAVIAKMQDVDSIKFYENGIVSMNLPISAQLVGARASRSTHPKGLHRMGEFFSLVFENEFKVENPFLWKTKSDVVKIIKDRELSELIGYSNSCSHVRTTGKVVDHCGVCSQCIDRRIAILHNTVEDEHDPADGYETQLFTDPLTDTKHRTMVESYIGHAKYLEGAATSEFFQKFPQISEISPYCGGTNSQAARRIFDLHNRHGNQVGKVIEEQIMQHSKIIRRKQIDPNSLLAIIIKQPGLKSGKDEDLKKFPTPADTKWKDISIEIVSNDSVRIKLGSITEIYTAYDMGFRDHRKKNMLNKQWEVLMYFAECRGEFSWKSENAVPGIQKHVQLLRNALKTFFDLTDNPIEGYRKKMGYITKFKISDQRYGGKSKIRRAVNQKTA